MCLFKFLYACILACLIICHSNYSDPFDSLTNKYNLNKNDQCMCLYDMAKPLLSPELLAKYDANQENITKETLIEIAKYIKEKMETSTEDCKDWNRDKNIEFLRHISHHQHPLDGSFTWSDIKPVLRENDWQLKCSESETPTFKIVKNPPDIFYYAGFSQKELRFLTDELALSVDQIFAPLINKTEDNFKEIAEENNTNRLEIAYFTLRIILGESPLERYIEQKSKATIQN